MPRGVLLSSCLAFTVLVACGSSERESPPLSDAVVYDASSETLASTGIAKWGYQTDVKGTTIFHGYGSQNESIVEIRHVFQLTSEFTRHFALKMNGPAVSGSVAIDFESVWQETEQRTRYVAHLYENTIPRDSLAAHILERLAPDARTIPDSAVLTPSSLTTSTSTKPLDDGPQLVDSNGRLVSCPCQLIKQGAATAAATASSGGTVGMAGGTAAAPASLRPLDVGGRPLPQDLIVGDNGIEVDSRWDGNYNVVDNNCHNAAAANIDKKTGFIGCTPDVATTTNVGHALNWTGDPTKPGKAGAYCAYNGEMNHQGLVDDAACCWEGAADAKGAPLIASVSPAKACVDKMCHDQDVWTPDQAPLAYPIGQAPGIQKDCPSVTNAMVLCLACCTEFANDAQATNGNDPKWGDYFRKNIAEYRKRCSTSCNDRELVRSAPNIPNMPAGGLTGKSFEGRLMPSDLGGPADISATVCLASGLMSNRALAEAAAVPNTN